MNVGKSKKADINISFSWIFMIIIGSFFVLFAYNVIDTYRDNEDLKHSLEMAQSMRTILNQIGKTTDSDQIKLEFLGELFKDSEVEILCNENTPLLSINGDIDANNQFLRNYPTFMTKIEEGSVPTTYLAVESFNFPFKITEMAALVSTKNVIVIDENFVLSDDLFEKFNKRAYREKIIPLSEDLSSLDLGSFYSGIKDKNPSSIMFVSDESISLDLSDISVSAYHLKIDVSDSNPLIGTISYAGYTDSLGSEKEFEYYDYGNTLSLITMALFSSPEAFDCSYDLLASKIGPVYEFYALKTQEVASKQDMCSSSVSEQEKDFYYGELEDSLNSLGVTQSLGGDNFINAQNAYDIIGRINSGLNTLEEFSCVYIY